jgi:hypothetical protein
LNFADKFKVFVPPLAGIFNVPAGAIANSIGLAITEDLGVPPSSYEG